MNSTAAVPIEKNVVLVGAGNAHLVFVKRWGMQPVAGVAVTLVGLGVYKLVRSRHFRWGGMQVGFRDLTIWSFLMASAHGAGLMVLPVVLAGPHAHHMSVSQGGASGDQCGDVDGVVGAVDDEVEVAAPGQLDSAA